MNFVDGCWWFQWLWHCLLCIGSNRSLVLISDLGPCHSCHACIFLQCHIPFKGAKVNPRRKHLDPCPCTEVRWFEPDNTGSACAKILLVSKIQFHILSKIVFACFSYIQLPRKQGSLHGRLQIPCLLKERIPYTGRKQLWRSTFNVQLFTRSFPSWHGKQMSRMALLLISDWTESPRAMYLHMGPNIPQA